MRRTRAVLRVRAANIQSPPALLIDDHQTAGGYPVVAGVAWRHLRLAAELLPGEHVRLRRETVERAELS